MKNNTQSQVLLTRDELISKLAGIENGKVIVNVMHDTSGTISHSTSVYHIHDSVRRIILPSGKIDENGDAFEACLDFLEYQEIVDRIVTVTAFDDTGYIYTATLTGGYSHVICEKTNETDNV